MATRPVHVSQCQKPRGWLGRITLWRMNASHSKLTDWGLTHVSIDKHNTILDVGCGGGRTVNKLAAMVPQGKVCGVDYSEESVAATKRMNARWIESGRVEVFEGSVSQLPFSDGMFDLVTGIETHFWWPNVRDGMREIFRVLKPGGSLLLTAEIYKGAHTTAANLAEKYASRMDFKLLSIDEHRELFTSAGFSDVRILTRPKKGWMCGTGKKP